VAASRIIYGLESIILLFLRSTLSIQGSIIALAIKHTCRTCSRYCRLQLLRSARPSAHSWLDGVPYTTLKGRNQKNKKKMGGTEGE
jgi:hypothetical protein